MKLLIPFALVSLSFVSAEPRTFTSPDGRTFQAEIAAATSNSVTLKMANGQTIVAPVTKFVQDDQDFVATWLKANPVQIKYRFAANFTKSKTSSDRNRQSEGTTTMDTWECSVNLSNQSGQALEALKLEYDLYYDTAPYGQRHSEKKSGTVDLGRMDHLQQMSVPIGMILIQGSSPSGAVRPKSASPNIKLPSLPSEVGSIKGIVVKVSHEGKQVFTWSSSSSLGKPGAYEKTSRFIFGK